MDVASVRAYGPTHCFLDHGDFNEDGVPDFVATGGEIMIAADMVFLWSESGYELSESLRGDEWV